MMRQQDPATSMRSDGGSEERQPRRAELRRPIGAIQRSIKAVRCDGQAELPGKIMNELRVVVACLRTLSMVVVCDDGDLRPTMCRERVEQRGAVCSAGNAHRPSAGLDRVDCGTEGGIHVCIVTGIG